MKDVLSLFIMRHSENNNKFKLFFKKRETKLNMQNHLSRKATDVNLEKKWLN